jgi:membrane protein YdbS with pleckstrin-like domain
MDNASRISHRGEFWVGVVLGLMIVTPVFAATTTWQLQDWPSYVLYGSLAALVLGVVMVLAMRRNAARHAPPVQSPPAEPCYSLDAYRVN